MLNSRNLESNQIEEFPVGLFSNLQRLLDL